MFSLILFAVIGATIDAGAAYWVLFGGACFVWLCKLVGAMIKMATELE